MAPLLPIASAAAWNAALPPARAAAAASVPNSDSPTPSLCLFLTRYLDIKCVLNRGTAAESHFAICLVSPAGDSKSNTLWAPRKYSEREHCFVLIKAVLNRWVFILPSLPSLKRQAFICTNEREGETGGGGVNQGGEGGVIQSYNRLSCPVYPRCRPALSGCEPTSCMWP